MSASVDVGPGAGSPEAEQGSMLGDAEKLLRVEDVARVCATSSRSVRSWISSGALPSLLISRRARRVRMSALVAFLAAKEGTTK